MGNGTIYTVELNINNPLVLTSPDVQEEFLTKVYGSKKIFLNRINKQSNYCYIIEKKDINKLFKLGYDAIIWDFAGNREFVVYDNSQIRIINKETYANGSSLIKESRGVSDDVQFFAEELLNLFLKHKDELEYSKGDYLWNPDGNPVNTEIVTINVGNLSFSNMFCFRHISFVIYDFNDLETAKIIFPKLGVESSYIPQQEELLITTFSVNKEIYIPLLKRALSHEMMHFFKKDKTFRIFDKIINNNFKGINERFIMRNPLKEIL